MSDRDETYDRGAKPFSHGYVPGAKTLADHAERDPNGPAARQLDAVLERQRLHDAEDARRRAQPEER